ncbi:MAG: malto-oligosyltrehalose synthase, partial [Actinomycetes bacterium]
PQTWRQFATTFLAATGLPNRMFGYFLAQVLLGAGRVEPERMQAYAEKAMREACDGTSWVAPDSDYESAVQAAVGAAYTDPGLRVAWDELDRLLQAPGWSNALGQKLVQLTMPGVPDVYQGTELWEDSLVDPDNRRAVDFALRRALLAADRPPAVDATGAAKLWLTSRALRARRDRPEAFTSYAPLTAVGPAADHLVGFDRGAACTLATRLPVRLTAAGGWGDTHLTLPYAGTDVLSGRPLSGTVALAEVFDRYPVALVLAD